MPRTPVERRACPICAGTALHEQDTLGQRQLARCAGCGHVFAARYDEAALVEAYRRALYGDANDPRIDAWADAHQPEWDALVEQLLDLQPTLRSLLDVGAGSGGFLTRLRAARPDVALLSVESSEEARGALRRRLPGIRFPVDEVERLSEITEACDAVTLLQTLEHLKEPLQACRGIFHCLRAGGLLIITVPNRRSLDVLLHGRRAECYANATHLQFFDGRTVERLLRTAGFVRIRRLVGFGGGQYGALLPRIAQYGLRRAGWSSELRFVASRP